MEPLALKSSGLLERRPLYSASMDDQRRDDVLWYWDDAVQRHGSNQAICDDTRSFTYEDLDSATDAIAAALICHGVAAEQLVGLGFARPIDYAMGMLAVLKAGGAFVIPEKRRPAASMLFPDASRGRHGPVQGHGRSDGAQALRHPSRSQRSSSAERRAIREPAPDDDDGRSPRSRALPWMRTCRSAGF